MVADLIAGSPTAHERSAARGATEPLVAADRMNRAHTCLISLAREKRFKAGAGARRPPPVGRSPHDDSRARFQRGRPRLYHAAVAETLRAIMPEKARRYIPRGSEIKPHLHPVPASPAEIARSRATTAAPPKSAPTRRRPPPTSPPSGCGCSRPSENGSGHACTTTSAPSPATPRPSPQPSRRAAKHVPLLDKLSSARTQRGGPRRLGAHRLRITAALAPTPATAPPAPASRVRGLLRQGEVISRARAIRRARSPTNDPLRTSTRRPRLGA